VVRCSHPFVGGRVGSDSCSVRLHHNSSHGVVLLFNTMLRFVVCEASEEECAALLGGVGHALFAVFPDSGALHFAICVHVLVQHLDVIPVFDRHVDCHLQFDIAASRIGQEVFSEKSICTLVVELAEFPAAACADTFPVVSDLIKLILDLFPGRGQFHLGWLLVDLGDLVSVSESASSAEDGELVGGIEAGGRNGEGAARAPSDNRPIFKNAWGREVPLNGDVG